jgi:hypothetical protein
MGKKRQRNVNRAAVNGHGGRRNAGYNLKDGEGDVDVDVEGQSGLTAAALAATNELLATAKELYRSLGGGSDDGEHDSLSDDEDDGDGDGAGKQVLNGVDKAYWRALPRRVRDGELSDAEFASKVREAAAALASVPTASSAPSKSNSEYLSHPFILFISILFGGPTINQKLTNTFQPHPPCQSGQRPRI